MSTTLYSVARRERGEAKWWDLGSGVSREQLLARLVQDGVGQATAFSWAETAALSVSPHREDGELAVRGDLFEHLEAGPRGESYKLVAVTVYAPNASGLRA